MGEGQEPQRGDRIGPLQSVLSPLRGLVPTDAGFPWLTPMGYSSPLLRSLADLPCKKLRCAQALRIRVYSRVSRAGHFRSAAAIADFIRASLPGATQHQSPRFESFSAHARSVGM